MRQFLRCYKFRCPNFFGINNFFILFCGDIYFSSVKFFDWIKLLTWSILFAVKKLLGQIVTLESNIHWVGNTNFICFRHKYNKIHDDQGKNSGVHVLYLVALPLLFLSPFFLSNLGGRSLKWIISQVFHDFSNCSNTWARNPRTLLRQLNTFMISYEVYFVLLIYFITVYTTYHKSFAKMSEDSFKATQHLYDKLWSVLCFINLFYYCLYY